MSESLRPTHVPLQPGSPSDAEAGAMEELRRLLLGQEQVKLSDLERRIDDPTLRVEDVSAVLPQAVSRCVQQDGRLAGALAPAVEESLRASIRRDPAVLANAIFPIIGPAIRKAVSDAFRRVMQTFSTAMEHSLSWRGLRWRWDAWRTGRPMAEVVLYHTLLYRVEQVFLIHRPSGLLLLHVEVPGVGTGDEDLVAGMLSAVRDFVQDSFSRSSDEELNSVQVGDRSVWVEPGPHAILAGAIRGHAPLELRQRFLDSLEKVHALEGPALAAFRGGEVSGFESLRETLESCLEERKREGEQTGVVSWKAAVALSIVLLGLLAWWGYGWLERGRDASLVSRLRAEPGILVTHAHRQEGRLRIEGLRDGLSTDPWALAAAAGLSTQRVEFRWEPYLALSSEMVLRRVRGRVETPGSVSLSWKDGVLGVGGVASADWWSAARERMLMVAGVSGVDASGLVLERSETWEDVARAIGGRVVQFGPARNTAEGQEGVLREVAAAVPRAVALSRGDARDLVLRIVGHTDRSGADAVNTRLSAQRAEWVRDRLVDLGLAKEGMEVAGAGSRTPASGVDPTAGENRRVTFSFERRR